MHILFYSTLRGLNDALALLKHYYYKYESRNPLLNPQYLELFIFGMYHLFVAGESLTNWWTVLLQTFHMLVTGLFELQ